MGFNICSQKNKYFNKLYLHIWFIAKTWLNIFVDDFEEHHKFEKEKRKLHCRIIFIHWIIMITIHNSFDYMIFKIILVFTYKY
jgi:uncharacterized membrane protein YbaN (DUF454 family)